MGWAEKLPSGRYRGLYRDREGRKRSAADLRDQGDRATQGHGQGGRGAGEPHAASPGAHLGRLAAAVDSSADRRRRHPVDRQQANQQAPQAQVGPAAPHRDHSAGHSRVGSESAVSANHGGQVLPAPQRLPEGGRASRADPAKPVRRHQASETRPIA